jgi:hypothetical protein
MRRWVYMIGPNASGSHGVGLHHCSVQDLLARLRQKREWKKKYATLLGTVGALGQTLRR